LNLPALIRYFFLQHTLCAAKAFWSTHPIMNKRRNATLLPFSRFAAIDFETADYGRDSACAMAVIIAENGKIIETVSTLIRPPRHDFLFTWLHGIRWEDVAPKPTFGRLWPRLSVALDNVEFIAAHNAGFDRGVLHACCAMEGIEPPAHKFLCTMKLARRVWNLYPTKLSDVCRHFGFPLKHHDAESDALACARIVLEASATGVPENAFLAQKTIP
jgi:DNA polymerase III subunit epsilon